VTVTSELGKGSLFTVRLPGVIMPCASKHSTSGYGLWADLGAWRWLERGKER
jgi:hypothetical protein